MAAILNPFQSPVKHIAAFDRARLPDTTQTQIDKKLSEYLQKMGPESAFTVKIR